MTPIRIQAFTPTFYEVVERVVERGVGVTFYPVNDGQGFTSIADAEAFAKIERRRNKGNKSNIVVREEKIEEVAEVEVVAEVVAPLSPELTHRAEKCLAELATLKATAKRIDRAFESGDWDEVAA
jgi:hypothetical protein